jgi:hypothetical protein
VRNTILKRYVIYYEFTCDLISQLHYFSVEVKGLNTVN